jgi:hypothetical protein
MTRYSGDVRCDSVCLYWGESGPAVAAVVGQDLLRALRLPYFCIMTVDQLLAIQHRVFRAHVAAHSRERVSFIPGVSDTSILSGLHEKKVFIRDASHTFS